MRRCGRRLPVNRERRPGGERFVVTPEQPTHHAHTDLVDADHLSTQEIDESPEDTLRALSDDGIDVERCCDCVDVDAGDDAIHVDSVHHRIQIDTGDGCVEIDRTHHGIEIDAIDHPLHVDLIHDGVEIDPRDDPLDIDSVDDGIQIEPGDEFVEIDTIQHRVEIEPIEERVEVESSHECVDIDAIEDCIDVDAVDQRVHVDAIDQIVGIDGIGDHGNDDGSDRVERALEDTPRVLALVHTPSVPIESRRDPTATPTTVADVSTAAPHHHPAESRPRPIDDQFTPTDWSLFVAVATIWGSSFLFIDIGLDALPPGVITLMRVGLGALALVAVPRRRIPVEAGDRRRVTALSIVWVAVPFTLFPIAEQHISSAVAGLLNGGTPIFAAIFAVVLFEQRTRGAQLLGIAIGFVGVVLVSLPSIGDGSSEALGVALVVAATVCYGLAVTIAAPLQQRYGSVNLMAKVLALATIWTAPYGLWQMNDASWEAGPVLAVVVLGVLGTGVAFALMGNLVGRVGSTRASFITYLIPAVALVLGVAFRGDDVVALELVGIVFVIAGALLASRRVSTR